jgi:hypothetical protein
VGREREWWRRAALVLLRPREVFATLREDTRASAIERTDVVAVLAFAAGVAAALAAGRSELEELDGVDPLIWVLITGLSVGFVAYWLFGWALSFVVRRLGGGGSPRRTRHVLAYAFAPFAFAIVLWLVYPPLLLGLAAWSLALLVIGLREVYGWTTERAGAAAVLAAIWLGALGVAVFSALRLLRRLGE